METGNYKEFYLTHNPNYFFPTIWIILSIVISVIFIGGIISNAEGVNVILILFWLLLAWAMFRNFRAMWDMVGKESFFLRENDIIYIQELFGIKTKKHIVFDDIINIELIDLRDRNTGNSYGILGYSDYKIEIKTSGKKKILAGKFMTKSEGELLLIEIGKKRTPNKS